MDRHYGHWPYSIRLFDLLPSLRAWLECCCAKSTRLRVLLRGIMRFGHRKDNASGVSCHDAKITLFPFALKHVISFMLFLCTQVATLNASAGFSISVASPSNYNVDESVMNDSLGITSSYVIENFEDINLTDGLQVSDLGSSQVSIFCGADPSRERWDGECTLHSSGLDVVFSLPPGVTRFGIGLEHLEQATYVVINNSVNLGDVRGQPNFVTGGPGVRNGYVWIDAGNGDFISTVKFDTTATSDSVMFDHAAWLAIPDITTGLVAHYELDGNPYDSSGNANHGAEYGGVGYAVGVDGLAAKFDGVDDYIEVSDSDSLDMNNFISMFAWVKPESVEPENLLGLIINKDSAPGGVVGSYKLAINYGQSWSSLYGYGWALRSTDGPLVSPGGFLDGGGPLPVNGEWSHIGLTYDGSAVVTYLNGYPVYTYPASGQIQSNDTDLRIGAFQPWHSVDGLYKGWLDDVRIYNRALTSTEIRQLYNQDADLITSEPTAATPTEEPAQVASSEGGAFSCGVTTEGSPGPVVASSGNYFRTDVDFRIPGLGPDLGITRHYHSQDLYDGPFGPGWNLPYTAQLVVSQNEAGDAVATVRLGNGVRRVFTQVAGVWMVEGATDDTLYDAGGGIYIFNGECGTGCTPRPRRAYTFLLDGTLRDGFLTAIADKHGNTLTIDYNGDGRIAVVTDANGRSITFSYGANGRVSTITDFDARVWSYAYDPADQLTTVTDPLGHTTTYTYLNGDLVAVTDAKGNVKENIAYAAGPGKASVFSDNGGNYDLNYDPVAKLTTKTNPAGGLFSFQYDDNGNITNKTGPLGRSLSLSWDAEINLAGKTDGRGTNTAYGYDSARRLTSQTLDTGALNLSTGYQYDPVTGELGQITDPAGSVTTLIYDAGGNLDLVTRDAYGLAAVTDYDYSAAGLLQKTTDADGIETAYAYDTNGYITRVYNPSVPATEPPIETTYTYDARGNRLSKTDANGNTTTYAYDTLDRLTTVTDALGNVTGFDYDENGNLIRITDAKGTVTEMAYDAYDRLLTRTEAVGTPLQRVTGYSYDSRGNLRTVTDPLGQVTTSSYDELSRLVSTCRPYQGQDLCWQFTYDAVGNLAAKTDPNGHTTSYSYDAVNRLAGVTDAEGRMTSYGYDANGNLTTVTDANLHTAATHSYDALNRLSSEQDAEGHTAQVTYTPAGRIATRTDANGQLISYHYDAVTGRLASIDYGAPATRTETFSYDAAGNLLSVADSASGLAVSYSYDALNRVDVETQQGRTLDYGYDANGNRDSLTVGGIGTYTYSYDRLNRLTAITDPDLETTGFAYDANDRRTRLTYGNGSYSDYSYDALDRLSAITHKQQDGTVLDGHGYSYDNLSNRTEERDTAGSVRVSYSYDATDQLVSALYADTGEVITFTYDAAGNRDSRTDAGGTTSYSYDSANRLIARTNTDGSTLEYSYDANGNLQSKVEKDDLGTVTATTTYSYDEKDRLATLGLPAGTQSFSYDPNDRRASSTAGGITTNHLYDGHNPLAELDTAGAVQTRYTPALMLDVLASRKAGGSSEYYLRDGINSVRAIIDDTESITDTYLYQPYGKIRTRTGTSDNPFTFTGRRTVADSELMYYRSRYYDPGTGRFLKKDNYKGSIDDPMSLHRYAYVHNNPGNYVDPKGEVVETVAFFGIVGLIGMIGMEVADDGDDSLLVDIGRDVMSFVGGCPVSATEAYISDDSTLNKVGKSIVSCALSLVYLDVPWNTLQNEGSKPGSQDNALDEYMKGNQGTYVPPNARPEELHINNSVGEDYYSTSNPIEVINELQMTAQRIKDPGAACQE